MSTLHVENLKGLSSGSNANKIIVPSGQTLTAPGHVIQVVSISTDHQQSFNTTSYTTFSNFSPTITPKFSNSKILVNVCLHFGENQDAFPLFKVFRTPSGGSAAQIAQGANNQERVSFAQVGTENSGRDQYRISLINWQYLDSPATTTALTYRVDCSPFRSSARTVYFNRHEEMGNNDRGSTVSTFTLTEIAQ